MFYIKSIRRYSLLCERYQKTGINQIPDYYLIYHEGFPLKWGSSPTPLNKKQLIKCLQMVDDSEYIEIETNSFS